MLDNAPFDARHGMAELANQILTHLQSHTVDPDSAVIGLPPSDDVIHKLAESADVAENCKLSKEELAKRITPYYYPIFILFDFVPEILKWTHLPEKEVLQAVRVCAASFRGKCNKLIFYTKISPSVSGVDKLKFGDIAVVRLSQDKYVTTSY